MPIIVGNALAFSASQHQWHSDPCCLDNFRQSTPLYLCVGLLRQRCEREGCIMIAEDNVALQRNIRINGQRGEATAREKGSREGRFRVWSEAKGGGVRGGGGVTSIKSSDVGMFSQCWNLIRAGGPAHTQSRHIQIQLSSKTHISQEASGW